MYAEWIAKRKKALVLSRAYFAETDRLRKLSGVQAKLDKLVTARAAVRSIEKRPVVFRPRTLRGCVLKAGCAQLAVVGRVDLDEIRNMHLAVGAIAVLHDLSSFLKYEVEGWPDTPRLT